MRIYGPAELAADVIQENLCIGCGACVQLCPYIRSYKGKTAMLFPCTHPRGRCFAFCPKIEVDLDVLQENCFGSVYSGDPLGFFREIHASRAADHPGAESVQAGGTVSALMRFALARGYLDAAVLTDRDGAFGAPRIVTDPDEVRQCASSKYAASPTLSGLNDAAQKGFRRIGVVATPCQATAIAQMRSNPLQAQDFTDPVGIVIGLFCTWALEPRAFNRFLSERAGTSAIKKMDIPPPPAEIMEIRTDGEKLVFPLGEIRPLVPPSCANCPDMTAEFSDLSVGVLENRPDQNILIIRTERGERLVGEAVAEGCLALEDAPEENIRHLLEAAGNKKRRAFSKMKKEGRLNSAPGTKRALVRVNKEAAKKILDVKKKDR